MYHQWYLTQNHTKRYRRADSLKYNANTPNRPIPNKKNPINDVSQHALQQIMKYILPSIQLHHRDTEHVPYNDGYDGRCAVVPYKEGSADSATVKWVLAMVSLNTGAETTDNE